MITSTPLFKNLEEGFEVWALVAMEKDNVFALWGEIKQVKDIDIDEYKDVKEESKRIKDYDFFENKLSGIAEDVDTLVVDTLATE